MTHAAILVEKRRVLGIEDGFIRLSVEIEQAEDFRADLELWSDACVTKVVDTKTVHEEALDCVPLASLINN